MAVIFLKIKAKITGVTVATASIFNADIRIKNNISLSSLSSQSPITAFCFDIRRFFYIILSNKI
jgi:hypothetical protein